MLMTPEIWVDPDCKNGAGAHRLLAQQQYRENDRRLPKD